MGKMKELAWYWSDWIDNEGDCTFRPIELGGKYFDEWEVEFRDPEWFYPFKSKYCWKIMGSPSDIMRYRYKIYHVDDEESGYAAVDNEADEEYYESIYKSEELPTTNNKYMRYIVKDGVQVGVDVYDVLQAFEVTDPCLQHLIKKALCAGLRGHKDRKQDLLDILASSKRAIELHEDIKGESK